MHEIIADGLDGERARQSIARINRAHQFPGIRQDDLTYVLAAFIVVPARYIDRVGWRPMLAEEREASLRFYQRLGEHLGIRSVPATYGEAERILDDYETQAVVASASTRTLGREVVTVLRNRLPWALRPLAEPLFASQLADTAIQESLGIRPGSQAVQAAIELTIRWRAGLTARRPAPTEPSFTPGQPAGRVFADGYQLSDLTRP